MSLTLKNLKLYKQLGLVVTKIHRNLEFQQYPWLKSYIKFNTDKRKAATSKKMTAKAIKKSYIKRHVRHSAFTDALRGKQQSSMARFKTFRSANHVISTVDVEKICLSPFDTKRYILPDGILTLAYGHYRIRDM